MNRATGLVALLGASLALAFTGACGIINSPEHDGIVLRAAEVVNDTVHIAFNVDVPQQHWSWYVDLDTDQALDASGHKTGYGFFGLEFEIDSRDRLADSVAVRPTSGPVDTSKGARGWPIPVGFARLDPSATVSLRFPAALLADDGILAFQIGVWETGDFGIFVFEEDSTHVRPPGPHGSLPTIAAPARVGLRRRG